MKCQNCDRWLTGDRIDVDGEGRYRCGHCDRPLSEELVRTQLYAWV